MIIYEGYFNNVEQSNDEIVNDVLQQSMNSDADTLLPKYQISWKPDLGASIIKISDADIRRLKILVDNTRYSDNCKFMISGYNLYDKNKTAYKDESYKYKPIDFFKYYETLDTDNVSSYIDYPVISIVHIFFDIDDNLKNNISYLVKVLVEFSKIIKLFCIADNLPNEYLSKMCFTPGSEFYLESNYTSPRIRGINGFLDSFKINVHNNLHKLSNGLGNDDLYKEFSIFWSVVFGIKDGYVFNMNDVHKALSSDTKCPKSLYNILINNGLSLKQIQRLEWIENKNTKSLEVKIPQNVIYSFNTVDLHSALLNTKLTSIRLMVDGTLVLNDVSDYSNLSILKGGYEHNKLIISTIVTPKILRRLLVTRFFNTIDLSNAKVTEDIDINMNYSNIMNPLIQIIPDKNNKINIIEKDSSI